MPPAAPAVNHAAERAARLLDDTCTQLAARSVRSLHSDTPEADFRRWRDAIREVVRGAGPDFLAALDFAADIPPLPDLTAQVLDDAPATLSAPQKRQLALRSLISNSLPDDVSEGSPRRLIMDMPYAGGTIGGAQQAWAALVSWNDIATATAPLAREPCACTASGHR